MADKTPIDVSGDVTTLETIAIAVRKRDFLPDNELA